MGDDDPGTISYFSFLFSSPIVAPLQWWKTCTNESYFNQTRSLQVAYFPVVLVD